MGHGPAKYAKTYGRDAYISNQIIDNRCNINCFLSFTEHSYFTTITKYTVIINKRYDRLRYGKLDVRSVAVWLSGNVVGQINEVTLRRAGLMLRWVTVRGVYRLGVQPSHPSQLSLVIPPWVDEMSTSGSQ